MWSMFGNLYPRTPRPKRDPIPDYIPPPPAVEDAEQREFARSMLPERLRNPRIPRIYTVCLGTSVVVTREEERARALDAIPPEIREFINPDAPLEALIAFADTFKPKENCMKPEDFQKPKRPVDRVFLHCSASDHAAHDNIATIEKWHQERGFNGVGYHYFIRKDGRIETGRDLERIPAAQAGHNTGTIAICLHGLEKRNFTAEQRITLIRLCVAINKAYEGKVTFHGHREVASKECPVFDYVGWLELDPEGLLGIQTVEDEYQNKVTVEIPVEVHRALSAWRQKYEFAAFPYNSANRTLQDAIDRHGL